MRKSGLINFNITVYYLRLEGCLRFSRGQKTFELSRLYVDPIDLNLLPALCPSVRLVERETQWNK